MLRSLRSRLTLGVTLVIALVLGAAGVRVAAYVDDAERRTVDDRLERTAELSVDEALAAFSDEVPPNDNRLEAVLRASGTALRLRVGNQLLLDAGRGAPQPAGSGARLELGFSTFTRDDQRFRAYVTTLDSEELEGLRPRLEVVTSLAPVERRASALRRRLIAVGALALLVAALGTWFAAEFVLRPLRRLRAGAGRIAGEEDLGRGVPADDGPLEVRALARSFNAMLERLGRSAADRERALDATRRFAADAGHELRTPLTSVTATLSALQRHPEVPADTRTEMLSDALAEQHRLVELLDGLQTLARGDGTPPEQSDVDLVEVVEQAAMGVASRHPGVDVRVSVPSGQVCVRGWEPGLRLMATNLLENAARHGRSPEDGGAVVSVSVDPAVDGGGPTLQVDDDGPGVPEDERDAIFEPFTRLEQSSDHPGSGLGLALVAQQARHHEATVEVSSSPAGGARFAVRFRAR